MPAPDPLPSWRPGPTRDALLGFLDAARAVPVADRVAVLDNDGTLWCEKPRYVQEDFLIRELGAAVTARPDLADRVEYAAVLRGGPAALADLGLLRTSRVLGPANEGEPKVANIEAQLGRRPIFAAGNSGGDRAMLDYAAAGPVAMALLIDRDDADREYAYESRSVTLGEAESIVDIARAEGWTVVSMRDDWASVF